ncbi:uncharacterized protein DUF2804 [Kineothrix alysoides]|uniref:Uncharacterized protein DUF2804 n=1 Tax=Kineothrix alysoides TaxID=1469948 RepID=A0A4R1QTX5_9FIRM|nr:DUF2804 domain-containing protein [Kineothrix alysoides]TCL56957.1 uncharacterized protein DUF2804 [Kineothrix alysoides]
MKTRNHEITTAQKLLGADGSIAERGWSRRLFQDYRREDIKAPKFRIKEWDYYLVMNEDYGAAFTISDDGYIGLQSVSLLDFKKKWEHTETILNLLPMGRLHMPSSSCEGDVRYEDKRLKMSFCLEEEKRIIDCLFHNFHEGRDFTCHIELEQPDMDTITIATPWKEKKNAFYYNQKINCMRARGWMELEGVRYEFYPDTDFGTLDWGRGVWTYNNVWFWGSGNCDLDGHAFGFNIGYGFGDTGSASENVIFYDYRAHKLEDVTFHIPQDDYLKPWKFTSSDGRFEMDFVPVIDRAAKLNALVIASDQHQVFGRMTGRAVLDDGTVLTVKNMMCFAEKVHNRY